MIELVRIDEQTTGEVTYTGVPTYNVTAVRAGCGSGVRRAPRVPTHSAASKHPATHQMLRARGDRPQQGGDHASTPRRRPVGPVAPPRHPTDTRPQRGPRLRSAWCTRAMGARGIHGRHGRQAPVVRSVHGPGGGERRHREDTEVERTEVSSRSRVRSAARSGARTRGAVGTARPASNRVLGTEVVDELEDRGVVGGVRAAPSGLRRRRTGSRGGRAAGARVSAVGREAASAAGRRPDGRALYRGDQVDAKRWLHIAASASPSTAWSSSTRKRRAGTPSGHGCRRCSGRTRRGCRRDPRGPR